MYSKTVNGWDGNDWVLTMMMKKLLSNNCYSKHTTQENLPTNIVIDLKKFEKNYMKKMKKIYLLNIFTQNLKSIDMISEVEEKVIKNEISMSCFWHSSACEMSCKTLNWKENK